MDIPLRVVTATLEVGDRPIGVAVSPDGRFIAVAESGDDQVRLLNAANFETITLIPVADRPYGLAFTPDGRLLVTHLLMGEITVIIVQPYRTYLPLITAGGSSGDKRKRVLPIYPSASHTFTCSFDSHLAERRPRPLGHRQCDWDACLSTADHGERPGLQYRV